MIDVLAAELVAAGKTGPKFHEVSRPAATEIEAVRRCIAVARMADGPIYFVHLSTRGATEAVAEARGQGWPVAGETCTHYLLLGPEEYDKPEFAGAEVVLTPPLRDERERDGLWQGLCAGRRELRPPSFLLRWAEGHGQERFPQDPERRSRD